MTVRTAATAHQLFKGVIVFKLEPKKHTLL